MEEVSTLKADIEAKLKEAELENQRLND